jgi:hypothetical protein
MSQPILTLFDMNAGAENAPIFMYLIRTGASLKWITRFMNQPIIKDYLLGKERYSSSFNRMADNMLNEKAIIAAVKSKYGKYQKFINSTDWYLMTEDERP